MEIGKAMGATVIAAASTDDELDVACSIGADHRINAGDLRHDELTACGAEQQNGVVQLAAAL